MITLEHVIPKRNDFSFSIDDTLARLKNRVLTCHCPRPERAASIVPILDCTNVNIHGVEVAAARVWILHSKPARVHISLLNKPRGIMAFDEMRQKLMPLREPYPETSTGYPATRLSKSDQIREVAR